MALKQLPPSSLVQSCDWLGGTLLLRLNQAKSVVNAAVRNSLVSSRETPGPAISCHSLPPPLVSKLERCGRVVLVDPRGYPRPRCPCHFLVFPPRPCPCVVLHVVRCLPPAGSSGRSNSLRAKRRQRTCSAVPPMPQATACGTAGAQWLATSAS
jgi:hypothetical protein